MSKSSTVLADSNSSVSKVFNYHTWGEYPIFIMMHSRDALNLVAIFTRKIWFSLLSATKFEIDVAAYRIRMHP